ncbi:hemin uptake protein HemP [Roseomonas sp. F4]
MSEQSTVTREAPPLALPKVPSSDLLQGSRELLILHHGETYRLRLTSNDKLILTK